MLLTKILSYVIINFLIIFLTHKDKQKDWSEQGFEEKKIQEILIF